MSRRKGNGQPEPGICTKVRWCQEPTGHLGMHRVYLGEIVLSKASKSASVSVTIEGQSYNDRWPVLTMGADREGYVTWARLDWEQATQLAGLLLDAERSYAAG